jgi:hypothetical protein
LTVNDFGSARVGAVTVTVGTAATKVGRNDCLPTGVLGFSSAAGTETGALEDFAGTAGVVIFAAGAGAFDEALGSDFAAGAALAAVLAANFGGAFFDVTFGGAFVGLGGVDLATAFGSGLALVFFADLTATGFFAGTLVALVTLVTLPALADLGATLDALALVATFGLAFAATLAALAVFTAIFDFAAGFGGVFFTTFAALETFVALPLALPLVAGFAFFAVANFISSAVFLLNPSISVRLFLSRERPNFENA